MIWHGDRRKLIEKAKEWIEGRNGKMTIWNFLAFLITFNLINEEKVSKYLKGDKKVE